MKQSVHTARQLIAESRELRAAALELQFLITPSPQQRHDGYQWWTISHILLDDARRLLS